MSNFFLKKIFNINKKLKIFLKIKLDILIITFAFVFSLFLRTDSDFYLYFHFWKQFLPLVILSICIFYYLGFYQNMMRYISIDFFFKIFFGAIFSSLSLVIINYLFDINFPRSLPFLYLFITCFFLTISRMSIVYFYFILNNNNSSFNVAIFGAGTVGNALATNLKKSSNHKLICFIDDDKSLQNMYIASVKVVSRENSLQLVKKNKFDKIFISIKNLNKNLNKEIFDLYSEYGISIQITPSIEEIINTNFSNLNLRKIELTDLLGREPVKPNNNLFKKVIYNKIILITGAGGSIGSEIFKQILNFNPKKLIILDSSEFNLYKILENIESNIHKYKRNKIQIIPILSNLRNKKQIEQLFKENNIDSIYHSAAYKHVSFVEKNITESFINNFICTQNLLDIALKYKVKKFTLISTDKAVNPTSIMGATKRAAELYCQLLSKTKKETTISIVRFGNVLGSSGSVIPKFQNKINAGEDIYIYHPELTRYFMLVSEASQLVIQASALANGGEVFVLEMGKKIKILDLAILMIRLRVHTIN